MISLLLALALQNPAPLTGTVTDAGGRLLAGVNVFILETLDGSLTNSEGRFAVETAHVGPATLMARRVGFVPLHLAVTLPTADLRVTMRAEAVQLDAINVSASSFVAADEPDAVLTSLQVVTTPGTAADVYRAIQTFPGLQPVDEGAGLFVRGGDVGETRIFLNDATVLSPYRMESPTGGFFGAFDPFLLDGIYFSSGGFGARYGDALSGVAALNTLGRPAVPGFGATAGLAALSATASVPLPGNTGVRATATRSNTELMFRLNGTTRDFTHSPEGHDLSGSFAWAYRGEAEVKVFALTQQNQLGVVVDRPAFSGSYDADEGHDLIVASWKDRFGRVQPVVSISRASTERTQSFGAFQLDVGQTLTQLHARAHVSLTGRWMLTFGGDLERRADDLAGSIPDSHDPRPGARVTLYSERVAGSRNAVFGESDYELTGRLRAIVGLRSDHSSLTERRSVDPRVALALRIAPRLTLTSAWGRYHQVPAPLRYEASLGDTTLGPMRADQWIAGIDWQPNAVMLRLEAYRKDYRDLAQTTRESRTVSGGTGRAQGADFFVRWNRGLPLTGRLSYSYVHATRTDPNTGTPARSPFDISHAISLVLERQLGPARIAGTWRYATGRPFTPVLSATPDTVPGVWVPSYGSPMSERLPEFTRVDLSASWMHSFWARTRTIFFVGLTNTLDRENVYDYLYSPDYTTRIPVRSQFKRAVYFGATMQL